MNYSVSKRSIYPGLETELELQGLESSCFKSNLSIRSDCHRGSCREERMRRGEDEEGGRSCNSFWEDVREEQFLQGQVAEVLETYYDQRLQQVISKGGHLIERLRGELKDAFSAQHESLLMEKVLLLKTLVGNVLIKKFKRKGEDKLLQRAQRLLQEEGGCIETPERRGKRLNNIGLCELLRGHCANGFKYFSKAFEIYREQRGLNLIGLLKNISRIYRQWEMYEQSVRCYEFILRENDRDSFLSVAEEMCIVVGTLESINLGGGYVQRKQVFHRADKLLRRMEVRRGEQLIRAKLKLQVIRYGVRWGLAEGDATQQGLQRLVREIDLCENESKILAYLKGCCFYAYREVHLGDWPKYRQFSQYAKKMFQYVSGSQSS